MVESVCRDCEIRIEDIVMKVDCELDKLDMILEMYFLTKYHAARDCSNNEVVLKELEKFKVKIVSNKKVELANIISVLKAMKFIRKRYIVYLPYIVDTQAVNNDPISVLIVCKYLDVFSKEMNGLPLKREIKFTIEVVLETTPISQTSYSMEPSELKELKDQLEELLERCYIQPNTSPWGTPILFVKKNDMDQ
ncbi:DNA/RNA polymerases superfamily protein [Cucumis melo var. makuwa]|uniref:DNA/RNA polymerases superfamily protein n=1 Tax=Cucumis melo var. makuwa TaxID=1194695 RepID=A0A5D3BRB8_CUCMM|nr:DNA/RNA polymerases superfamily protein [Cucumis melo var. makuwa]